MFNIRLPSFFLDSSYTSSCQTLITEQFLSVVYHFFWAVRSGLWLLLCCIERWTVSQVAAGITRRHKRLTFDCLLIFYVLGKNRKFQPKKPSLEINRAYTNFHNTASSVYHELDTHLPNKISEKYVAVSIRIWWHSTSKRVLHGENFNERRTVNLVPAQITREAGAPSFTTSSCFFNIFECWKFQEKMSTFPNH